MYDQHSCHAHGFARIGPELEVIFLHAARKFFAVEEMVVPELVPFVRARSFRAGCAGLALSLALCGCASTRTSPPQDVADRAAADPQPVTPLEPDPGPAVETSSEQELLAALERIESPRGWARVLLELRKQLDIGALMRLQDERGLTRLEGREMARKALEDLARNDQAELVARLDELLLSGRLDYYEGLRFRNRIFVSASPETILQLCRHPSVARVIPEIDGVRDARRASGNRSIKHAPPVPPGHSWAVEALGLPPLWEQGIDGRGVTVAVLDSGVMGTHAAFAGNKAARAWYDPKGGQSNAYDTVPHGSQVLSCAVGRPVAGRHLGAAPAANWIAALSNYHNSYNNIYMSLAADWLMFETEADVILGAWGHGKSSCDPRDLPMVRAFRAVGMLPVFAAGNDGPEPSTAQTPAALSGLYPDGRGPLAVAAVDRHMEVIPESSRGPVVCQPARETFPDIAAPGRDLPVPTAPTEVSLTLASGTSFAVGWVGGTAALVLQLAPDMPIPQLEDLLRSTARDLPPQGIDPISGYGLLDPEAAVEAARAWASGR